MKKLGFALVIFFAAKSLTAQTVTNLRAFEEDGTILLVYDLFTAGAEKQFYVTVKFSTDKGNTFNSIPSPQLVGDVNQLVKLGADRMIKVSFPASAKPKLSEVIFQVEAEKVLSSDGGVTKKEYYDDEITVTLLTAKVLNSVTRFTFLVKNKTEKTKTIIIANFVGVDNNNKEYRDYKIPTGTAFEVRPTTSSTFSLELNGAPGILSFSKIQFNVSSSLVTFRDIVVKPN